MIRLRDDCLWVSKGNGQTIPLTVEQITVELLGDTAEVLAPDVLRHAAAGVLQYFKVELGREMVTVAEFAEALAQVLRQFGVVIESIASDGEASGPAVEVTAQAAPAVHEHDLRALAMASGKSYELAFFPALRRVLHDALAHSPKAVFFRELRGCVKQLSGCRRWCSRCRSMEAHVVAHLQQAFRLAGANHGVALIIR